MVYHQPDANASPLRRGSNRARRASLCNGRSCIGRAAERRGGVRSHDRYMDDGGSNANCSLSVCRRHRVRRTHLRDCGNSIAAELGTVEAYDPGTGCWSARADMPTARHGLGVANGPNGLIYALGGTVIGETTVYSSVEAYDPTSDDWTTVAPMLSARFAFGAAAGRDGRIYAVGGTTGSRTLDAVEAYDAFTHASDGFRLPVTCPDCPYTVRVKPSRPVLAWLRQETLPCCSPEITADGSPSARSSSGWHLCLPPKSSRHGRQWRRRWRDRATNAPQSGYL